LICISADVANQLRQWLDVYGPDRPTPLAIAHFPLGSDIEASVATTGFDDDDVAIVDAVRARRTFLMVGTVEPRKGHHQAVEAFDQVWREGLDVSLAIVGKRGWMTDHVEALIEAHPEYQHRLIRIDDASDELLEALYGQCAALLAASRGEGFGLPIVEAARHGIPIIARDIPVFREVAREGAHYFWGDAPSDLATAIREWVVVAAEGNAADPKVAWRTDWATSTQCLIAAIKGQADCHAWIPRELSSDVMHIEPTRCVIEFSSESWPGELMSVSGISGAEPWGRWSDANVGPSIALTFSRPLPKRGILSVTARAFGPNCGGETKIRVGDANYIGKFGATDSTLDFELATDGGQFTLELIPPAPTAPTALGLPVDARRIGIGVVRVEIR
jgi:hypothetical protein